MSDNMEEVGKLCEEIKRQYPEATSMANKLMEVAETVQSLTHENSTLTNRLTAAMKVVEAARDTLKGTESMATSATCQHCTKMMVKMLKLFEALAAMKDPPKGRFLPDIEDLSHTIDFEKPKCGECGGSGYDRQACKNESPNDCISTCCHGCQDATPCPECDQGKE